MVVKSTLVAALVVAGLGACTSAGIPDSDRTQDDDLSVWFVFADDAPRNPQAKPLVSVDVQGQPPARKHRLQGTIYARTDSGRPVRVAVLTAEMRMIGARRGCDVVVPVGNWWRGSASRTVSGDDLQALCLVYRLVGDSTVTRPRPRPEPTGPKVTQAVSAALVQATGHQATLMMRGGGKMVGQVLSFNGMDVELVDGLGRHQRVNAAHVVAVSIEVQRVPREARIRVYDVARASSSMVLRDLANEQVQVALTTGGALTGKVVYFDGAKLLVRAPNGVDATAELPQISSVLVIRTVVQPMAGTIRRYTAGADPPSTIARAVGNKVRVSRVGGMQLVGTLKTFEGGMLMVQLDGGVSQMVDVTHVATVDVLH